MPAVHSRKRGIPPTTNMTNNSSSPMNSMNSMTPFPSDLSIFDHNDEEIGDDLVGGRANSDSRPSSSNDGDDSNESNKTNKSNKTNTSIVGGDRDDQERLSKELLDALYLGTSNFLLAYNTRAGIGVLMRIFKLLQKGYDSPPLLSPPPNHLPPLTIMYPFVATSAAS